MAADVLKWIQVEDNRACPNERQHVLENFFVLYGMSQSSGMGRAVSACSIQGKKPKDKTVCPSILTWIVLNRVIRFLVSAC